MTRLFAGDNPTYGKRWRQYILYHNTCEPNTANRHIESRIFAKFVPVPTILFMLAMKLVFGTLLWDFMSVLGNFVRQELWVNVTVVIFFRTVDFQKCSRVSPVN